MQVRQLCEVLQDWARGCEFTASLGDGSNITSVGRPHKSICEVHSERGVEYRDSTEIVLCQEMDENDE